MNEALRSLLINGLTVLVQILILVAGTFAIQYLKKGKDALEAKMGKDNFTKLQALAKTAVYAVEQQYPNMVGSEKYKSAMMALNDHLKGILTTKELNDLIEAAVGEMNLIKKNSDTGTVTAATVNNTDTNDQAATLNSSSDASVNTPA